jgi:uncharacterized protein
MAKGNGKTVTNGKTVANLTSERRAILQNLSSLAGRMRMLEKAGLQYGGKRDVYQVAGYVAPGQDTFDHYWGLYTRGDIAGRIVDMPAKTTWRTPPDVAEKGKPEDTEFTTAFDDLADRLKIWRYFERGDRLAGVGEYAVILLGVRGVSDQQLAQPLGTLGGPDALIYLGVYSQKNAQITKWVTDTGNPRFGLPELYQVQLSSGERTGFGKMSVQVHASRLIHVAEDLLEDEVFGRPRLQRTLNRLFDLDKITASTGESFWQAAARILQAKIDPAATTDESQLDELEDRLEEMVHDLRRQFVGQGAELSWLPTTVSPVKDIGDLYFTLISAAAGIPRRILFGNEVGELASTTDQATYFGTINERQEHFAEPQILRAFIDRLVEARALPQPGADGYEVEWPSLFELTELEQADANLKRAQTAQALTPVGGDPLALVEIDESGNVWLLPRDPQEADTIVPPTLPPAPIDGAPPTPGAGAGATGDGQPAGDGAGGGPGAANAGELSEQEFAVRIGQGTQVQTLIFPKAHWATASAARAWALTNRFRADKVDETTDSWRLRQREPGQFQDGSFRTICLTGADAPGNSACRVKAVIGRPRGTQS